MKSILLWSLRCALGLMAVIVVIIFAATLLRIPIDLTRFKTPIESMASQALSRPVSIEESIVLSTSLKPIFNLRGLRINNLEGFSDKTFIYLESVSIQLELLPLLKRKLHLAQIIVEKLNINLEETAKGNINWVLPGNDQKKDIQKKEPPSGAKSPNPNSMERSFELAADSIVVKKLELKDISLNYRSPGDTSPSHYKIQECIGIMLPKEPLNLDIKGSLLAFPYELKIGLASLDEFIRENRSWMEIEATLAKTNFTFAGEVNLAELHNAFSLHTSVFGKNLSDLNTLAGIDLPPLGPYRLEADLTGGKAALELKHLTLKTGSSSLNGNARINRKAKQIIAAIDLDSPNIQINDFIFENWKWIVDEGPSQTTNPKPSTQTAPAKATQRKLKDPDLLKNIDAKLSIHANKVLSGKDLLGSGDLKITLQKGRLEIKPLNLTLPGGGIKMAASFTPGKENSDGSIRVIMKNFDIGIVARRNDPETTIEGLVNLDIDLASSASSLEQIFARGNGYFDFAGRLKNLEAGIIDLWAVNLIAAIVSRTDETQSQINCAIGRWTVKNGILTPDVFFIDTSKIRICGTGQVDFTANRIDMVIAPTPKRPEFFNLATPLEIHGSFSDLNFGLKKGALVGTTLKFITSPLLVPLQRLGSQDIPEDGSDACTVELGPANRSKTVITGCK
jgi:uncharacterized protein involved in outer membrane biogenesis